MSEYGRQPRHELETFVQPLAVEDEHLVGTARSAAKSCLVEVRAELPPNLTPGSAMAQARAGRLVLVSGRMAFSRLQS